VARILLHEPDAIFRALLEDWFHVASHQVEIAKTAIEAQRMAVDGVVDALVLEIDLPETTSGLDLIRSLRTAPQARHFPIVVVSHRELVADRVEALRTGADDYLVKPCDSEELILRVEKLLQRRSIDPSALEGHLDSHSAWDLVQFLQNSNKTGNLIIQGAPGPASITVRRGDAIAAQWGDLEGSEALIALLGQSEGSFRFLQSQGEEEMAEEAGRGEGDSSQETSTLAVRQLLMEAAWVEDELRVRARYLPARGVPLQPTGKSLQEPGEDFEALPLHAILEDARGPTPLRLYDLHLRYPLAPQKINLAVAYLVENELLDPIVETGGADVLTTEQIDTLQILTTACGELLTGRGGTQKAPATASYLLLAEASSWHRIDTLFEPRERDETAPMFRRLRHQLKRGFGGSVSLRTDFGTLFFHVQMLRPETRQKIEQVAPLCDGVVFWVDEITDLDLTRALMQRFERGVRGTSAVIVTGTESLPQLRRLGTAARGWSIAEQHPRGLLGVIRLLEGDTA